ncbi:MAG TPA: cytochrome c3 family protein [Tepidisphaeraceae bacterium]|jgi:hypothetical protein
MAQLFKPWTNSLARGTIYVLILGGALGGWIAYGIQTSPYASYQGVVRDQPVPFSHEHHVGGLGIDCRYCHTSVTDSSFAGLPATQVCMTCHSQIWTNAALLEPVRQSWRTQTPIHWTRVNSLPGYVYFDHSIHVAKGVGCATCHGPVDRMPLMYQAQTLQMRFCLDCHRDPTQYLRPRDQVFNMAYQPPPDQARLGRELAERYHVRDVQSLTNCSTCHR